MALKVKETVCVYNPQEESALPPLRFSAVRLLIARNVLEQNLSHQIHDDSHSSAAKLEKLLSLLSQSQEPSLAPSIVTPM